MTTVRTSTELDLTFGERLAKARRLTGLTQAEMAARLGVGRRSIVRYEDGEPPSKAICIAWAVITDVPTEWLESGIRPDRDENHTGYLWDEHPTLFDQQLCLVGAR